MTGETIVTKKMIRPTAAATCLVLRDSLRGLEVLMVERNRNIEFGGGALVFPGGKLDLGDLHKVRSRYYRNAQSLPHMTRALAVTAIREVFEETGLLLTRSSTTKRRVGEAQRARLAHLWRDRLGDDKCDMDRFFAATGHYLDFRDLGYYARWITPYGMIRRYDTYFFVARAPKQQIPSHDGWELVNAHWMTPEHALQLEQEKEVQLMFPTRMNLRRLSRCHSVTEAFTMMRAESVVPVLPQIEKVEGRVMARIPTNAGYGSEGLHERLVV